MSDTREERAQAVGHIPSGLFIVCAKDEASGRVDGFLASWVQQVSFDPLKVSLCVNPGRPASEALLAGKTFTINVVGDHDKSFLKHFWKGYDPNQNPFEEIDHQENDLGGIELKGARSTLTLKKSEDLTPGDHHLVVAEVLKSTVHSETAKSMVHTRKNGLSY